MELDEDDSHLCIRCNETIIGLQNYVNHRQQSCSLSRNVKPPTQPFSTSYDFLNSHVEKKIENYSDFSFTEDRDDEIQISEPNKPRESVEYKQYDYDFFSSLELQYMSKRDMPLLNQTNDKNYNSRILTRRAKAAIMSQRGDEWIDENNVGKKEDPIYKYYDQNESESEEESEESEPEVPSNYTRGKWKPGSRPPMSFTGGKWKPGIDRNITWDENESSNDGNSEKYMECDNSNPPPSHTKGKWIPGIKIMKLEVAEKTERDNFWCNFCSRNLANRSIYERHLKSNLHQKRTKQQNDLELAAESLPNLNELSRHFKAIPAEKSIGVEMNRRAVTFTSLAKIHENVKAKCESVEKEATYEGDEKTKTKKFRSRSKVTCEECDMKLPVNLLGNHLISHFHYRKMLQNPKKSFDIVLNNFHKIIIQSPFQCHPCKFYFNTQEEFLRHWNSKGHLECVGKCHGGKFLCSFCKFECLTNVKMSDHLNSVEHQQVVTLINRSKPIVIRYLSIVKCKNCAEEFRYNLQLMKHLEICKAKPLPKFSFSENFLCDICSKAFQSALSLQKHKTIKHKSSIFFCSECKETFESAKEAKSHRKTARHRAFATRKRLLNSPKLKAPLGKACPICKEKKLDNLELKDHLLEKHPEHKFSCGRCGMKFPLAQEISRHVRDKVCKFYKTPKPFQSPPLASIITTNESQNAHTVPKAIAIITSDPVECGSFSGCAGNDRVAERKSGQRLDLIGNSFTALLSPASLPYQEAPYNEHEECGFGIIFDDAESNCRDVEVSFACKLCEFSTSSHAEFLFHEALHRLPLVHDSKDKMECQICKKLFGQQSLREHLRQHTNERIFECPVEGCPMNFTRKANLKNHITNVHKGEVDIADSSKICTICGKKFQSKYILEQHKFLHRNRIETKTFPCHLPNCIYIGRNSTDAKNHLLTHADEKLFICTQPNCDYRGQTMEQLRSHSRKHQEHEFKFTCERCEYKTKLSSHLKRHMRVHELEQGKIYKCPHCDYSSNNTENLRKHVLRTNKHQGKFLYECNHCDNQSAKFRSNLMKEYQSHLQLAHNLLMKKSWSATMAVFDENHKKYIE